MSLSLAGNISLGLAAFMALLQIIGPGRFKDPVRSAKIASSLTLSQFLFTTLAFFTLMYAYVMSDFSIVSVALHSHTSKPLMYKISGVWGNHEGSMLLWVMISTFMGTLFAYLQAKSDKQKYIHTLQYMGVMNFCFFLYISLTSNPFFSTESIPLDGRGMNPLLQDPAMTIHPPMLYLGYVGFVLPFAMLLGGLRTKTMDIEWFRAIRPWVLFTWGALTVGITLGSYWAYYELGWGGWWFWDPVENASLMPWCFGTALIHSLVITEKEKALQKWSVILIYLSFIFCILGAFLTRSGIISSVHSFATSPERGHYIIAFIALISFYFFFRFFMNQRSLSSNRVVFASREGLMLVGNMLVILIVATICLGTFYPLFVEIWSGHQIFLEAPFFNMTIAPLVLPLVFLMTVAPLLAWEHISFKSFLRRIQFPLFFLMVGVLLTLFVYDQKHFYAVAFISFSLFLMGGVLRSWVRVGFSLPLRKHGMHLAHLGFALCLLGMAVDSYNVQESLKIMKVGDSVDLGAYTIKFEHIEQLEGPNFQRETATLGVYKGREKISTLHPEKRLYLAEKALMSEVALKQRGLSEIYAVLGDFQGKDSWTIRLYYHPLVLLIWLGGFMIGLGAVLSIFRRKNNS